MALDVDRRPVPFAAVARLGLTRRGRRALLFVGLLVVIVWVAFAVRAVIVARDESQQALDILDDVKHDLKVTDFMRGDGKEQLLEARHHLADAHASVDNPFFAPFRLVPYVGRQLTAVDDLSGGATKVLDVGIGAIDRTKRLIDSIHDPQGAQRIALVHQLGTIAAQTSAALDRISLGPGHALVAPLQDAHDRFVTQLDGLRDGVHGLADASGGLASFLSDSHYLVIAANNSEMRVGEGAFLSLGEMTVHDGHLDIGEMHPAISVLPPAGAASLASVDPDLQARWGFMQPTGDFRELAVTSRFDAIAPVALKMWQARTGHSLDGVLVIDPVALKALLHAVGSVTVNGVTYDEHNVLQEVFVEQYRGLTLDPSRLEQEARREQLSDIARATLKRLETGHWDTVKLIEAMRDAVHGRHVLVWSSRPVEERGWEGARVDGRVPADELVVAIHNRAGNKLDQFLPTDATLDTAVAADGATDCTLDLSITNVTDLQHWKLPNYVVGPYPGTPFATAGRYIGWVVVELPGASFDSSVDVDGARLAKLVAAGADGPDHRVLAALVAWDPHQQHTVTVHFRLPTGDREIEIAPTGRVLNPRLGTRAAVQWRFGTDTFVDDQRHTVTW